MRPRYGPRTGAQRHSGLSTCPAYKSVQEAWLGSLAALLDHGTNVSGVKQPSSVGSDFGDRPRDFHELTATSFTINSPRQRLTCSARRPIDVGYALANFLWVISGSAGLAQIRFYNENAARFSDDGISLFGAPGERIFRSQAGNQFEEVANRLQVDPSSRRAVINVYSPADLFAETRDCSCLTHLQFFVRGGVLNCIANMRSQSALMVMPYDLALLTMIHEAMSVLLDVPLGRYTHCCGSLHYYREEEELVRSVLAERLPAPQEMPAMNAFDPSVRQKLECAERHLRHSLSENPSSSVSFSEFGLDSYWRGILATIVAAVRKRKQMPSGLREEVVPDAFLQVLNLR